MESGEAVRLVSNYMDEHLWRGNVAMNLVRRSTGSCWRGERGRLGNCTPAMQLPCGDESRKYVENPDSGVPFHGKE
jgi:hypothetical protein